MNEAMSFWPEADSDMYELAGDAHFTKPCALSQNTQSFAQG